MNDENLALAAQKGDASATRALLEKYSWDKSAERLLQILEK